MSQATQTHKDRDAEVGTSQALKVQAGKVLILASTSIYRKALLERITQGFLQVAPRVDEDQRPGEAVSAMALRLAIQKADEVARRYPDALVIGSDQAATLDGKLAIGKPGYRQAAVEQLRRASGQTMYFHTALALVCKSRTAAARYERSAVVETVVRFRNLSLAMIEHYLDREPAFECAGAAKCEGLGIVLMESIQSDDPTALIGLPLIRLTEFLSDAGYALLCPDPSSLRA